MKKLLLAISLATSLIGFGCGNDLEAVSQISKFRIMGVQAEPPEISPGENTDFSALFADPEEKGVQVLWMPMTGNLDGQSSLDSASEPQWFPSLTHVVNGVATYGSSIAVPPDYLDALPAKCSDDYPSTAEDYDPNWAESDDCTEYVTMLILGCAGGELDSRLTGPVASLQTAYEQYLSGEITLEELMAQVEASMSSAMEFLGSFEAIQDLGALCVGEDSESVVAIKTLTISNSKYANDNPSINNLEMRVNESWTAMPSWTDPGYPPQFICDPEDDGCRKPADIRAYLTAESFQSYLEEQYGKYEEKDDRLYISWFIDGGNFNADRSGNNGEPEDPFEVSWTPPREGGEQTLWAVVHDLRGGISWKRFTVVAIAP